MTAKREVSMEWKAHPGAKVADTMAQNSGCFMNNVQKAWGQQVKEESTGPPALDVQTHRQTERRGCLGKTTACKGTRVQAKDDKGRDHS